MKAALALITISTVSLLLGPAPVLALDPSLEVSQYAHTAWTVRDGFSVGAIFAMAQTPDGYLWLGAELGLFRFDGVRSIPGNHLRVSTSRALLTVCSSTRDGTLWIGTFDGLVSWSGGKLTRYPEVGEHFVTSLLEDREGTVWAGIMGQHNGYSDRPAVRNPKRPRAMLPRRTARSAISFGVWLRTAQALSGSVQNLVSGDGILVPRNAMRRRGANR